MKTETTTVDTSKKEPAIVRKAAGFNLVIPDEVYQKVMWWINKSQFEVSGFGNLEYDAKTRTFTVTDAILLDQENNSTETEMDGEAIAKAMYECHISPGDEAMKMKWWWHSHVMMSCFWSGTDMSTMRQLGYNGWILATVLNQKCEMRSAFMTKTEVLGQEQEVFIDDIPTSCPRFLDSDLVAQWDADYTKHVKNHEPRYSGRVYSYGYTETEDLPKKEQPRGYLQDEDKIQKALWDEEEAKGMGLSVDDYRKYILAHEDDDDDDFNMYNRMYGY